MKGSLLWVIMYVHHNSKIIIMNKMTIMRSMTIIIIKDDNDYIIMMNEGVHVTFYFYHDNHDY